MKISERLEAVVRRFCENKSEFCKIMNIANSTYSSWITRDTMDYYTVLQKFPVKAEWLLRGIGTMCDGDPEQYEEQDKEQNVPVVSELELNEIPIDIIETKMTITDNGMITIPVSVLEDYRKQLREKDTQIKELITKIK